MGRTGSTFPQPDVFSPPDWRWLIACKIHESPKPRHKRRTDPEWLWPLLALAKLASGRKLRGPRTPPSDELVLAFQLYQSRRHQDWELEARILAGQTDDEIAAAMDFPAAVVSAYEQTFFSVRDRLTVGDYILIEVIGYSPFRGFEEGDLQTLWGYFAYAAGPKILELVMAVSLGRPLPDWALREAPCKAAAEGLRLGIKAMLLACTGAMTATKLRRLRTLREQIANLRRLEESQAALKTIMPGVRRGHPKSSAEIADKGTMPTGSSEQEAGATGGPGSQKLADAA